MGTDVPKDRGVVLVVDDDEDYRALVRGMLERDRYFVIEAANGQEALDVLSSGAAPAIRLIILDLAMPEMSGWQLVERVREDPVFSRIPILVASANSVHGDASGIGVMFPSLGKPFDQSHLLSEVAKATARGSGSDRRFARGESRSRF